MVRNIVLEKEQKELISALVESSRNVSHENRKKFFVIPASAGEILVDVIHDGLPTGRLTVYPGDIDILCREGLLSCSNEQGMTFFDVSPQGFKYYEQINQQTQQPVDNLIGQVKAYVETDVFRKKYPIAYRKWVDAEALLWKTDSEQQLTTIGHLCREAIQEFATSLVTKFKPSNIDNDKAHDINRIHAVLLSRESTLGKTEIAFLNALLDYWKTISKLVQRQEHGSQREKENLIWEDGRRVIFQTLVVMYEVDRALSRNQ